MSTSSEAAPLVLSEEIVHMINNALTAGTPILLSAVDRKGRPQLSFRGSTQVFSYDQLGLWVRNTQGGTLEAISGNPNVALMYRSATTPFLKFQGRARITTDPDERSRVFANAPEREQQSDPQQSGVAVIIDLDLVEGVLRFGADGPVLCRMARAD